MLEITLLSISGLCWTIAYLDIIRLSFRDRTTGMPAAALMLNVTWEVMQVVNLLDRSFSLYYAVTILWLILDIGILAAFLRFGRLEQTQGWQQDRFLFWSFSLLLFCFLFQWSTVVEFGIVDGTRHSALLQNAIMSVAFIPFLLDRGSDGRAARGQSLLIAVTKGIGTLAAGILIVFLSGSVFHLSLVMVCAFADTAYTVLLWKRIQRR